MSKGNDFAKNRELTSARLEAEKEALDRSPRELSQQQLGKTKFQDIADQRYQSKMADLYGNKFDVNKMHEDAKKRKKGFDLQRDIIFFKKWQ